MRHYLNLVFLFVLAISVSAQNPKPAADRVAAQNALFEEQYETDLRNFPERATSYPGCQRQSRSSAAETAQRCSRLLVGSHRADFSIGETWIVMASRLWRTYAGRFLLSKVCSWTAIHLKSIRLLW
jgi:hypothetical protein